MRIEHFETTSTPDTSTELKPSSTAVIAQLDFPQLRERHECRVQAVPPITTAAEAIRHPPSAPGCRSPARLVNGNVS